MKLSRTSLASAMVVEPARRNSQTSRSWNVPAARSTLPLELVSEVVPKALTSFVQDDMGIKRVSDSRMS